MIDYARVTCHRTKFVRCRCTGDKLRGNYYCQIRVCVCVCSIRARSCIVSTDEYNYEDVVCDDATTWSFIIVNKDRKIYLIQTGANSNSSITPQKNSKSVDCYEDVCAGNLATLTCRHIHVKRNVLKLVTMNFKRPAICLASFRVCGIISR